MNDIQYINKIIEKGREVDWRLEERAHGLRQNMFPFFYPSRTILYKFCTLAVIVSFEFMTHFR